MQLTGSTTDLRRHNRDIVLRAIRQCGTVSRTEIADRIGLTNAAVSRITKELIDAGLIEEGERVVLKGQAGRRQVSLKISKDGAYVLGIAVTLNARDVVIANGHGDIIERVDCADISLDKPDKALRTFARRAKKLMAQSGVDKSRIIGGAASVAGRVNPDDGRIMGAEPLDWDGQKVAAQFEKLLGIPFVSEGRAAALLMAESNLGQAEGLSDVLLINVGLKLGTALMMDGCLMRGASNEAFMLGRYQDCDGKKLDDTASGFSILSRLQAADFDITADADPGTFLRDLAENKSQRGRAIQAAFRKSGEALGQAIAKIAPILSPQAVILAGFVIRQPSYTTGVKAKIGACNLSLRESRFTTAQSAIHLALEHHLFNQRLQIDRLITA